MYKNKFFKEEQGQGNNFLIKNTESILYTVFVIENNAALKKFEN